MSRGSELIDQLKDHILATMRRLPECGPGGEGARRSEIEKSTNVGWASAYDTLSPPTGSASRPVNSRTTQAHNACVPAA